MKQKRFLHTIIALTMTSVLILSGCGTSDEMIATLDSADTTDSLANVSSMDNDVISESGSVLTAESMVDMATADMFTDRDLSGDSNEGASELILLDGESVTITKEGTYILSGALTDGMITVDVDDTEKVQLVLDGVEVSNSVGAAIYVKQADKVFITLAEGTTNTLKSTGEFVAVDENNIDAVIFSKEDLTINGNGILTVESAQGHGIVSKDDLVIASGTITVNAASKGLSGNDSIRIADGDISITSGTDAIHAGNGEDTEKGFVYIENGTLQISAGDDGIHADNVLLIAGGNIGITKSYEGLEALAIEIQDGEISLVSDDDGLNAAGGNDNSGGWNDMFASQDGALIHIAGGHLSVNAAGDGIDSNGDLYMTGGNVYVSGPTNSGNGALDYNGTAQITGGVLMAVGASGMAQNFSESSTQGAVLVNANTNQAAGTEVNLLDSEGNVLVNYTSEKSFNSVVVSCPGLEVGKTYILQIGSENTEITLESLIYGNGQGMGGFGGDFGGGMRGEQGFGGRNQEEFGGERPDGRKK